MYIHRTIFFGAGFEIPIIPLSHPGRSGDDQLLQHLAPGRYTKVAAATKPSAVAEVMEMAVERIY